MISLQQGLLNTATIEAAAAFNNPAPKPVQWTQNSFTLFQGIHKFPFTLQGSEACSPWHTGDMSNYQDCWDLCAVTGNMSISPFFGVLFGLGELAKQRKGHVREGRSYSIYPGQYITPGQLRLPNGQWITAIVHKDGPHELLLLGGIPAGSIKWPNMELMAYQHLSDRELARSGIPRLSRAEQLPTIWSPSQEALEDILTGLNTGKTNKDFTLAPWEVPIDLTNGNTNIQITEKRVSILREHERLHQYAIALES